MITIKKFFLNKNVKNIKKFCCIMTFFAINLNENVKNIDKI